MRSCHIIVNTLPISSPCSLRVTVWCKCDMKSNAEIFCQPPIQEWNANKTQVFGSLGSNSMILWKAESPCLQIRYRGTVCTSMFQYKCLKFTPWPNICTALSWIQIMKSMWMFTNKMVNWIWYSLTQIVILHSLSPLGLYCVIKGQYQLSFVSYLSPTQTPNLNHKHTKRLNTDWGTSHTTQRAQCPHPTSFMAVELLECY